MAQAIDDMFGKSYGDVILEEPITPIDDFILTSMIDDLRRSLHLAEDDTLTFNLFEVGLMLQVCEELESKC